MMLQRGLRLVSEGKWDWVDALAQLDLLVETYIDNECS